MRKILIMAAMMAMVLALASPAFAQTAIDNSTDGSTTTTFDNSFNLVEFGNQLGGFVSVTQVQSGDSTSAAAGSSAAATSIDQSFEVFQTQTLFLD